MVVSRELHPGIADGTSREDLAIFLSGWRRNQAWAVREDPAVYDARLIPLLDRLEDHLRIVRRYSDMSLTDFLTDRRNSAEAQYYLLLAIVAMIDSTRWLAGKVRLRGRPRSFADAFDLLVTAGTLPPGNRAVYVDLARLRNRIVHEAVSLPPVEAHTLIGRHLPALEEYRDLLRGYLSGG